MTIETTTRRLNTIGDGLKKYFDRYHSDKPYPFIAGGAVRDLYFGYEPKDYDVFLDASAFPEDEREDVCDLLSYEFPSAISGEFTDLVRMDNPSTYPFLKGKFRVYSFYGPDEAGRETQLICTTEGNRDTIIAGFDYDLVRCYYDISTKTTHYSPEFLAMAESKVVVSTSKGTTSRILNWFDRNNAKDFTIDKQYEKPKPNFDIKAETYRRMYGGAQVNPAAEMPMVVGDHPVFFRPPNAAAHLQRAREWLDRNANIRDNF